MKKSYQIVDLSIGGNVIRVTATVEDDGSLTIYDLSYGPSADLFYGAGREVEYWLKIPPDSAEQLSMHLLGKLADDPVDEVANSSPRCMWTITTPGAKFRKHWTRIKSSTSQCVGTNRGGDAMTHKQSEQHIKVARLA